MVVVEPEEVDADMGGRQMVSVVDCHYRWLATHMTTLVVDKQISTVVQVGNCIHAEEIVDWATHVTSSRPL